MGRIPQSQSLPAQKRLSTLVALFVGWARWARGAVGAPLGLGRTANCLDRIENAAIGPHSLGFNLP
jgi:hypothetical protein